MNTTRKWCVRNDEYNNHGACKVHDITCRIALQFWEDVVDTIFYLINRGLSSSLDGGIPEEAWIGKKVNYFLKPFGCYI